MFTLSFLWYATSVRVCRTVFKAYMDLLYGDKNYYG